MRDWYRFFRTPIAKSYRFWWVVAVLCGSTAALGRPPFDERDRIHPVYAEHGMVATQEATASRIGLALLQQGGNAVDAAVAVGFALAVSLPQAGNLGGGGFMLLHDAGRRETVALDFRETAPAAAGRTMFLDEQGEVDAQRLRFSHRAVAVPGTVAGLSLALERYGSLPLAAVVAPAVKLADEGIVVSEALAVALRAAQSELTRWPDSRRIFFKPDGSPYAAGDTLRQPELAASLRLIAGQGAAAFYSGAIADRLVAEMTANGGLIGMDDLKNYRVVVRPPLRGSYRGYEIVGMPPPSSGGVHLIQLLNLLEHYPIGALGHNSAATLHRMIEAMKLVYADRSEYLGDADFVPVPVAELISKRYAAERVKEIDVTRARPVSEVKPGRLLPAEGANTTHYSVVDAAGNAVAVTYTLNLNFGAGIVAAGTGILLNNEMDDFSARPGVANAFGLPGGEANAIAPGKRPLSSMTPTLVFRDGQVWLVTGSPGGSRIITTVLQIVMNVVDHGLNIAEATLAPRVHHQWLPDELRVEEGISVDTVRLLEGLGHNIVVKPVMGNTHSILRLPTGLYGFSDTRQPGTLTVGY
jgi:gamma-glutamyltranspeptidase/glutathione hydrolase